MKKYLFIVLVITCVLHLMACSAKKQDLEIESPTQTVNMDTDVIDVRFFFNPYDDEKTYEFEKNIEIKLKAISDSSTIFTYTFCASGSTEEAILENVSATINSNVKYIVINPVDAKYVPKILELTSKAKMPVIFINTKPLEEDMLKFNKGDYAGRFTYAGDDPYAVSQCVLSLYKYQTLDLYSNFVDN